jgi:hypothetical protein
MDILCSPPLSSASAIKPFTFFDALIIALLTAAAAVFFPIVNNSRADEIAVVRDNRTIATYTLAPDRMVSIKGAIGPMELEIKNKSIRVVSSTCPKQICLDAGAIRRAGQQIICSPNHILIEIVSLHKDGPDAVTR